MLVLFIGMNLLIAFAGAVFLLLCETRYGWPTWLTFVLILCFLVLVFVVTTTVVRVMVMAP